MNGGFIGGNFSEVSADAPRYEALIVGVNNNLCSREAIL